MQSRDLISNPGVYVQVIRLQVQCHLEGSLSAIGEFGSKPGLIFA